MNNLSSRLYKAKLLRLMKYFLRESFSWQYCKSGKFLNIFKHPLSQFFMDQELMIKASFLEREISELGKFSDNLDYLSSSQENTILSSLGKGVLMKTEIKDRKLFVDVGSGVLVRKESGVIKVILEGQIEKFKEARIRLIKKHNLAKESLISMLKEIGGGQDFTYG